MSFPESIAKFTNDCRVAFNETVLPTAQAAGRAFKHIMVPRPQQRNESTPLYILKEVGVGAAKFTALLAVSFLVASLAKPVIITLGVLTIAAAIFVASRKEQISKCGEWHVILLRISY
jgi:hypothetical protein